MNTWDGIERREIYMHEQPLAECMERHKSMCDKLDNLIYRLDKMNGRYDDHLKEAIPYRAAVDSHTKKFDQIENQTRWVVGTLVSVILSMLIQISTFAFLWGQLTKRVEINTERLYQIELLHPRMGTVFTSK